MRGIVPNASEIATYLSSSVVGTNQSVVGLHPVSAPAKSHLSFVVDLTRSRDELVHALDIGAIVLVPPSEELPDASRGTLIVTESPRASFASVVSHFFAPEVKPGIAATAVVDPSATVASTAHIGEFTIVGPGAVIGAETEVRNHAVIGAGVEIGDSCIIKSHAVIGEEGFGIDKDKNGNNIRLPHLGSVRIGDSVEIGSFTTVNSGTISPTIIDDYVKIDDHVHVAHNCHIGWNSILTACVEISGSVVVGNNVWVAPNASVREKLSIGDGAMVGIGAVVTHSIEAGQVHFGNPARRIR